MVDRTRRIVQHELDLDTSRLYGPLKDAIEYLQEIQAQHPDKELSIDEHWFGYEDIALRFVYRAPENDQQYSRRIFEEEHTEARQRENAERERKLKAYAKEQADLKRKYGIGD